jgi:hypothetical protein
MKDALSNHRAKVKVYWALTYIAWAIAAAFWIVSGRWWAVVVCLFFMVSAYGLGRSHQLADEIKKRWP